MTGQQVSQAIFPDLPRQSRLVDQNGNMTPQWRLFFDNLVLVLQTKLKPEGYVIPEETADNIALLTSSASIANIIYDDTNNAFDGNIVNTTTGDHNWVQFATILFYDGNPNSNVAGNIGQLLLDTTDLILYVCTTGGSATGAVWTST